jgi:hypothetical protein
MVQVVHSVLSGARLARPARCPRELYQLMLDCWAAQPEQRPSFTDILALFRWGLSSFACALLMCARPATACGNLHPFKSNSYLLIAVFGLLDPLG